MLKVYHDCLFHQPINAFDKGQMRRVLGDVVISILDRSKLDDETVCDAILLLGSQKLHDAQIKGKREKGEKKRGNIPAISPASYLSRPLWKVCIFHFWSGGGTLLSELRSACRPIYQLIISLFSLSLSLDIPR